MAGKSRTVRWQEACAKGREALESMQEMIEEINSELADKIQELTDQLQTEIDTITARLEPDAQKAREALEDLEELKNEYEEWYDNMPEQLQDGPTGEKLQEISYMEFEVEIDTEVTVPDIELPEIEIDLSDLEEKLDEAEGADLPLGFGRD